MQVFISYSTKDHRIAEKIAESLRFQNYKVWRDENDMRIGDQLNATIVEGINSSGMFVLVLTRNWNESSWCQRELEYMQRRIIDEEVRLVVLIFNGGLLPENIRQLEIVYQECSHENKVLQFVSSLYVELAQRIPVLIYGQEQQVRIDIPRYGIRLLPSRDLDKNGKLGHPERKYVFIGDFHEQYGKSLRHIMSNLFLGRYLDGESDATLSWTAIRFEIGETYEKKYDLLPGTWKSIFRILSHPRRLGMIEASEEDNSIIKKYRVRRRYIYYGDEFYCIDRIEALLHDSLSFFHKSFGIDSECFDGSGYNNESRIFLVKNLDLSSLNCEVQELGRMDDGVLLK